jgi:hypothetical protein
MNRKIFLLGLILLVAGQLFAQEMHFATKDIDGIKTDYQTLENMQKIVFEGNMMTIKMKSAADVANVSKIIFGLAGTTTEIETQKLEQAMTVFPNPAKTTITVSGVGQHAVIALFDTNGSLLQSTIAEGVETTIDVSALKRGMYLLQAEQETVKFIKQ